MKIILFAFVYFRFQIFTKRNIKMYHPKKSENIKFFVIQFCPIIFADFPNYYFFNGLSKIDKTMNFLNFNFRHIMNDIISMNISREICTLSSHCVATSCANLISFEKLVN